MADSIITTDKVKEVKGEERRGEVRRCCNVMLTDCQIVLQGIQGHSCLKSIIPHKLSQGSPLFMGIKARKSKTLFSHLVEAPSLLTCKGGKSTRTSSTGNTAEVTARFTLMNSTEKRCNWIFEVKATELLQ